MNYLVIGYGNTLRGDDGAGQKIAESVANWELPEVRSLPVHQLTPELAEEIANASTVIFVDAVAMSGEISGEVRVQCLEARDTEVSLGHHRDPRSLLALTQAIYGRLPSAYWILIPAVNFEFGEQLSPTTEKAMGKALEKIKGLIDNPRLKNKWIFTQSQ